ncbi:DNA-binding protein [Xanthomonas perforans]|uniref:HTH-type DNA-binding transcriptional activator EutR n=9 Tax=Xanthomonas TaxID=338 RepID=J7JVN0_XANMN|nr:AraC-type transcriptional regulator HrpX [Xanthomonas euvesicatoria pv. citrumelo F1]AFQ60164.1 HrpX [Xanthomonas phaseoli pv. manihotis]APO99430.1 AraC family transcriptional regulator [Xanthomonas perforans]AQS75922.1 AraC family transcriptional regulator [Xanthomonas perforans 91-118]OHX24361.1 DNA-binding protein [Xanthomonas alfalfae]OQP41462.1 AraC family transcriptional regulator [Xanthomonas euvesicatoria]PPU90401.1 AraC family transcriptional regulator [Xanthomonas euvesicatoria p
MILSTYFAAISALSYAERLPTYTSRMLVGAWPQGLQHLQQRRDGQGAADGADDEVSLFGASGDALLILEYQEEAEDAYRQALKAMRGHQRQLRLLSCRNTAWLMLSQRRLSAALNCFAQLAMDRETPPSLCGESLLGKSLTHFHLGQSTLALQTLERAREVLADLESGASDWLRIATALRLDMIAQLRIRRSDRMSDHVFWQATLRQEDATHAFEPSDLRACIADLAESMPVLAQRMRHVRSLLRIAGGDTFGFDAQIDALPAAATGCPPCARQDAQVELALAALAVGRADLAERALAGAGRHHAPRWNLEFEYCQAKISQAMGRTEQALLLYNRYALGAVQCLRSEVQAPRLLESGTPAHVSDDISARLPAKYRRAYSYMITNAHRSDLSINEVAAQIGVTGRALQQAFKSATGLSPTQVLRRYRMQSIRDELLAEGGCGSVLQAASRWGVGSRSALAKGYRQHFNEAPMETLQR